MVLTEELAASCSKTALQASLRSDFLCLRQASTFVASGMKLAHSRKASGVHAALCSEVPLFSCAKAASPPNKAAGMTTTHVYLIIRNPG